MTDVQNAASSSFITSTLFGGVPSQTNAPSQGSIRLYKDDVCLDPLTTSATPLLIGDCLPMPDKNISSVAVDSLPVCDNFGSPLLIISDTVDCKKVGGPSADSGAVGSCQTLDTAYSSAVNIGSVQWVCYGKGISSVVNTAAATSATPASQTTIYYGSTGSDTSGDDDDSCCCCSCSCCTVM